MVSFEWGFKTQGLEVMFSSKGFRDSGLEVQVRARRPTWRFMGSYKWSYKIKTIVTLLFTPLITSHEPPSRLSSVWLGYDE